MVFLNSFFLVSSPFTITGLGFPNRKLRFLNILCNKEKVWRELCQKVYRRIEIRWIPEIMDIRLYKPEGKKRGKSDELGAEKKNKIRGRVKRVEIMIFVQQSKIKPYIYITQYNLKLLNLTIL